MNTTLRYTFTAADGTTETREHPVRDEAHGAQLLADARALHGADCDAEIIHSAPGATFALLLAETRGNTKFFAALNAA